MWISGRILTFWENASEGDFGDRETDPLGKS
jgi:hypothetical protein